MSYHQFFDYNNYVICSIGVALYMSYHQFLDYGYTTSIVYEHDHDDMEPEYPSVTICSNSPVYAPTSLERLVLFCKFHNIFYLF